MEASESLNPKCVKWTGGLDDGAQPVPSRRWPFSSIPVKVGRRFDRDHVLVRAHPEFFATPRRPLVKK